MISSKQVALLMCLLAASFACLAGALAADGVLVDDVAYNGMKLTHLIIGTAAAGVSLWFLPKFETKALGATVSCGMVCALLLTPFSMWAYITYFSTETHKATVPIAVENVLAAGFGIGGVYIVPGVAWAWRSVRDNPWGFFAWIRSGGKTPPPDQKPNNEGGQP